MFWLHGNVGFLCGCLLLSLLLHLTLPRPPWLSIHEKHGSESSQYQRQEVTLTAREQENPTTGNRAYSKYYCPQRPGQEGVDIYAEPVP